MRKLGPARLLGAVLVPVAIAAGCSGGAAPKGDLAICKAIAKLGSRGPRPTGAFATEAISNIHSAGKRTETPLGKIARSVQAVDGQIALRTGDSDFVAARCRDLGVALPGLGSASTS